MEVFKRLAKFVWNRYPRYFVMMIQRSQLYRWHVSRWRYVPSLVQRLGPRTILEIGVGKGKGAERLIKSAKGANNNIRYYGFDLFEDAPVHNNVANLSFLHRISTEFIPPHETKVRQRLEATGADINLYKGDVRITLLQRIKELPSMDLIVIDCGPSYELLSSVYDNIKSLLCADSVIIFEGYPCEGVGSLIDEIDHRRVDIIHHPLDRMDLAVLYF